MQVWVCEDRSERAERNEQPKGEPGQGVAVAGQDSLLWVSRVR